MRFEGRSLPRHNRELSLFFPKAGKQAGFTGKIGYFTDAISMTWGEPSPGFPVFGRTAYFTDNNRERNRSEQGRPIVGKHAAFGALLADGRR